jgi:hypothetical protein
MVRSMKSKTNLILAASFVAFFGMAFMRIHMRVQSTLIGYEIGRLKDNEASLLEKKSQLQMQLAKLTTRQHLSLMAETDSGKKTSGEKSLASR